MDLYYHPMSPPSNAVAVTMQALNLKVNIKEVNIMKGENRTPEYLKMNPQHTVPTLDDSGFYLWESRAILTYLVNKYGSRDDPLLPKDPKPRALVEQRLHFDGITLYPAFANCYYPVLFGTETEIKPEALEKVKQAFEFFDLFLDSSEFAAVDTFSVADISLLATVSSLVACNFDLSPYKRVALWYDKVKTLCPSYDEFIGKNVETLRDIYDSKTGKVSIPNSDPKPDAVSEPAPEAEAEPTPED